MGICTDFLTQLIKLIPNAFRTDLPPIFVANCLIFDGTAEIEAFLHSKSNNQNNNGLENQKFYDDWRRYRKQTWLDMLMKIKSFSELSSIICLVDVDRKVPAAKNVERLRNREYSAYTMKDLILLNMIEDNDKKLNELMKSGGYTIDINNGSNNKEDPSYKDEYMVLTDTLKNNYIWGDPKRIWATIPLRTLLKNKYCDIIRDIFGDNDFLLIPATTRLHSKYAIRVSELEEKLRQKKQYDSDDDVMDVDKVEDDKLTIKEAFAIEECAVRYKSPLLFIDGISKKQCDPDILLSSVESMEEYIKTDKYLVKTSLSPVNNNHNGSDNESQKYYQVAYMDEPRSSCSSSLIIKDEDSIDAPGIFMAPLGYKERLDLQSHGDDKTEYTHFSYKDLHSPGEADLKLCNFIQPDYGTNFVIRSDDTDLIPIVLKLVQQWHQVYKKIPNVWLDRTCNNMLRTNMESVKRYINVTEIWKYYHALNIPIERIMLLFLLKESDYVIPFDELNKGKIPGLEGTSNKASLFAFGVGSLMNKWFVHQKFKECVSIDWSKVKSLNDTIPLSFDEYKLQDFIFSRYREAVQSKVPKEDKNKYNDIVTLQGLENAIANYNKSAINNKVLLCLPKKLDFEFNIKRIGWNLNYWLNGTINARKGINFDNPMSPALECLERISVNANTYKSKHGWDIVEVSADKINPLDITQMNLPSIFKTSVNDNTSASSKLFSSDSKYFLYNDRKLYTVELAEKLMTR